MSIDIYNNSWGRYTGVFENYHASINFRIDSDNILYLDRLCLTDREHYNTITKSRKLRNRVLDEIRPTILKQINKYGDVQ